MKALPHSVVIMALLFLGPISQAQQVTSKYNGYMYGGGPHKVWWKRVTIEEMALGGEDSEREDANPTKFKKIYEYSIDEIPLPYFSDKDFASNTLRQPKHIRQKYNHYPPQHVLSILGKPSSIEFFKSRDMWRTIVHGMSYIWSKNIYADREYIILKGKMREIAGVEVILMKTKGDFSCNNMEAAIRSKWVINDARLKLSSLGRRCVLNMCNPTFPCPGHGLPDNAKKRIRKTKTIAEQMFLQEAYVKNLESKFAGSKELQTRLTNESTWYYRKSLKVRTNRAIAKK